MDRQVRASDSREQEHQANSQEGHAPSIPRAQARADLRGLVERRLRAHVPASAHALDSVRAQASEHVQALAAQRRPLKLQHARSARVHDAAAEASSSTPRPKKAR